MRALGQLVNRSCCGSQEGCRLVLIGHEYYFRLKLQCSDGGGEFRNFNSLLRSRAMSGTVISCSLSVMTSIWICQRTLEDAVQHGDIKILGDPALTRRLRPWLGASGLAALGERGDSSTLLRSGIVS